MKNSVKESQQIVIDPKRKSRPKKVRTFGDEVWHRFGLFINHWPITLHREVKRELAKILFARYASKGDKWILPVSVTLEDGTTLEITT
jgi:hypothetical protein